MAPPSGLAAQIGIADEVVSYGTAATVSRFYEFVSESVKMDRPRIESKGLRAGARVLRSSQWAAGGKKPGGDVEMELANKSFGLWFKHMFGAVASVQPDAGGNPTVWEHTFTPGDLTGKSFTFQAGRPDQTGTVRPFTYPGGKVAKWEMAAKVDELATLKLSLLAQDEDTVTGLAAASYPTGAGLFVFTQGTLSIAGSAIDVKEVTLSGDNKLSEDRSRLGAATRKEPLETAQRDYTGSINSYFPDLTAYTRFTSGTEAQLILDFVGGLITGTYNYELKITQNVRFDGDTPAVSGPVEIMQPLKIKAIDPGTGAITVLYRTTDTTP